jgi:hypothetical protein
LIITVITGQDLDRFICSSQELYCGFYGGGINLFLWFCFTQDGAFSVLMGLLGRFYSFLKFSGKNESVILSTPLMFDVFRKFS